MIGVTLTIEYAQTFRLFGYFSNVVLVKQGIKSKVLLFFNDASEVALYRVPLVFSL